MDCLEELKENFLAEPYARRFGIEAVEIEPGRSLVRMRADGSMNNIFGSLHGGAIFSLMDAAFELCVNSHGTVAVALSISMNYLNPASAGETLLAEGREVSRSSRISACEIKVTGEDGRLIATAQALAYRKRDPLPFL